jgi:hypothetical protein
MKKILFPIDFSGSAPEAFKCAAELAYFYKARLDILHLVYNPKLNILA